MAQQKTDGPKETYTDDRELAFLRDVSAPMLSRSGYNELGSYLTRVTIGAMAAAVVLGTLVHGIAKHKFATDASRAEATLSRIDMDGREESIETAKRLKLLLEPLSHNENYIRDKETGMVKLTESAASEVIPLVENLKGELPNFEQSRDYLVMNKLFSVDGASPKEISNAYYSFERKMMFRKEREQRFIGTHVDADLTTLTLPSAKPFFVQ